MSCIKLLSCSAHVLHVMRKPILYLDYLPLFVTGEACSKFRLSFIVTGRTARLRTLHPPCLRLRMTPINPCSKTCTRKFRTRFRSRWRSPPQGVLGRAKVNTAYLPQVSSSVESQSYLSVTIY